MSFAKFLLRRLLYLIPVFFGLTFLTFTIERLAGDPVALMTALNPKIPEEQRQELRRYYGLDRPLHEQYLLWVSQIVTLNLGNSYVIGGGAPVKVLIEQRFIATVELQILGLVFSFLLAIPLGIYSARRRYSKLDNTLTATSLVGTSIPIFFLGILFILFFGGYLHQWTHGAVYLPAGGAASTSPEQYPLNNAFLDHIWHLILPTMVYTFALLAPLALLVRSSMLEVLRQDFILALRASGVPERIIIYKHALRNALIPIATYLALYAGAIIVGAPITETVFNWPGVGQLFVLSNLSLDFPVIQGLVLLITIMTMGANLLSDIGYAIIDPRIRLE